MAEQNGSTVIMGKGVPITVVLFLIVQTVTIAWWASSTDTRLTNIEDWHKTNQTITERLVKIEATLVNIEWRLNHRSDGSEIRSNFNPYLKEN